MPRDVSNNRVLLMYYSARQRKPVFTHGDVCFWNKCYSESVETEAPAPWGGDEWTRLTVKASVCSSGSISTSSGGCSTVSSSSGCGCSYFAGTKQRCDNSMCKTHVLIVAASLTFSSISYSTPKMGLAEYTLCKELISFRASWSFSTGSILNPRT